MAHFDIISSQGQHPVIWSGAPKYVGAYLKPGYIEFPAIGSPTAISWHTGDYVVYTRTGKTYRLYRTPQTAEQATASKYGAAFLYENVQFYDDSKQLEFCPFTDLVPGDNTIHFSTANTVSFFGKPANVAERLQACLENQYGAGTWEVRIVTTTDADLLEILNTEIEFSVSGANCLEVLDKVYNEWSGLGWIHTVESGVNVITIGASNVRTNANTTAPFAYDNGLVRVERSIANADQIGTRLFAYGSMKNMDATYYRGLDIYQAESVDIEHLMIPIANWGTTDSKPDARKAFIDNATAIAALGLIPRTAYFDGSGDLPDIHPTIERMTIGEVYNAGGAGYLPDLSKWSVTDRIDVVVSATNPTDHGTSAEQGQKYAETISSHLDSVSASKAEGQLDQKIWEGTTTKAGRLTLNLGRNNQTFTMMSGWTNPEFSSLQMEVLINGSEYAFVPIDTVNSGATTWTVKLPETVTIKDAPAGTVAIYVFGYVLRNNSDTYANARTYTFSTDATTTVEAKVEYELSDTFVIRIPQIGFDIDDYAALGEGKTVSFKTGMCAGRDFVVKDAAYVSSADAWDLTLYRSIDEDLNIMFPNADYEVAAGDQYVLLDIAMPDMYVTVASSRLLAAAQKLLADISVEKPFYSPQIDAKRVYNESRMLREGMWMDITLNGDQEYVIIDSITIDENGSNIPTYEVALRQDKGIEWTENIGKSGSSKSSKSVAGGEEMEADGTVTSVAVEVPTGLDVEGSPITTRGVIRIKLASGYKIPLESELTQFFETDSGYTDGVKMKAAYSALKVPGLKFNNGSNALDLQVVNVAAEGEAPVYALRSALPFFSESWISAGGVSSGGGQAAGNASMQLITGGGRITNGTDTLDVYSMSNTYTKQEVNSLIGSISGFKYEIYASLGDITQPSASVLYLIGPTGSGADKYEEYVYSNSTFVKIGDTSIDLSGYATQTWVQQQGYLTSHQTIYALTIKNSGGTTELTYTPNSGAGSITLTKGMVGLGNVENTALSTWAGSSNITTLGTITTGTWHGSTIGSSYLPSMYIGTTAVQFSSATQNLTGIGSLTMTGALTISTTKKIYFGDTNHYVELDSNGYFHFSHGLYSDSFVSAGGISSGGGTSGIDLPAMWANLQVNASDTYGYNMLIHSGHYLPNVWASLQNNDIETTYDNYKFAAAHLPAIVGASGISASYRAASSGSGLADYLDFSVDTSALASAIGLGSYVQKSGDQMTGTLYWESGILDLKFTTSANYETGIYYHSASSEALVFAAKDAGTSFIFKTGLAPSSLTAWNTITPSLQIVGQSVYINELVQPNSAAPSYNFRVNGSAAVNTLYTNNITSRVADDLTIETSAGGDVYIRPHNANTYINWGDRGIRINGYADNGSMASISTRNNCNLSFDVRGAIDQLYLSNTGKVGINTFPYCQLEVAGTRANADSTSVASSAMFAVNQHTGDGLFFGVSASGGVDGDYGWIQSGYYGTSVNPTSAHAYPIVLNPLGGNVYIGQTSGTYKLDVNGVIRATAPSNDDVPLRLEESYGGVCWIAFNPSGGATRYVGVSIGNELYFQYGGSNKNVLHSGNYGTYALPLSAGTSYPLTGPLMIQSGNDAKIILDNTDDETDYQFISFRQNGTQYGTLGTLGDAILKWNNNTLYHSGNANSRSVDWNCLSLNAEALYLYNSTTLSGGIERDANNQLIIFSQCTGTPQIQLTTDAAPIYRRNGTNYTLYHSGNSNNTSTAWSASSLTLNGAISGATNIDSLIYFDTTNSRIGFGTDAPNSKVEIAGAVAAPDTTSVASTAMLAINKHNDDGVFIGFMSGCGWLQCAYYGQTGTTSAAHTYKLNLNPLGGYVGINLGVNATPSYALDVAGVIHASTGILSDGYITAGSASSREFKDNVQNMSLEYARNIIMSSRPITFQWNVLAHSLCDKYEGDGIGFIAQEAEQLMPFAVSPIFEKYKRLDYTAYISPLVRVAQSHETRIQQLERESREKDAKIAELENQLRQRLTN